MATKAVAKHRSAVAALGCVLCRVKGFLDSPAEIHHPRTGVGAGQKSSEDRIIGLCPLHHRLGNEALHVMGRKAWERFHGVTEGELLTRVQNLLSTTGRE